jgi:hypothetical protein
MFPRSVSHTFQAIALTSEMTEVFTFIVEMLYVLRYVIIAFTVPKN